MTKFNKKLTVITVTLNAVDALLETLNSIAKQKSRNEFEFIVIDGESVDESLKLLEGRKDEIDVLVSSKDRSVYDAMNKGVQYSQGEWLYFLNAGDVFLDEHSVCNILKSLQSNDVVYSDVQVDTNGSISTFSTSFNHRILNHQGFVYRRKLHETYGPYAVIDGFTAADYLYFLQLHNLKVEKLETPIATFKTGGLSSTITAVRQKYCLDFLAGKISALNLAFRLLAYPTYRYLKNLF